MTRNWGRRRQPDTKCLYLFCFEVGRHGRETLLEVSPSAGLLTRNYPPSSEGRGVEHKGGSGAARRATRWRPTW